MFPAPELEEQEHSTTRNGDLSEVSTVGSTASEKIRSLGFEFDRKAESGKRATDILGVWRTTDLQDK
jgi:hypothetical protein